MMAAKPPDGNERLDAHREFREAVGRGSLMGRWKPGRIIVICCGLKIKSRIKITNCVRLLISTPVHPDPLPSDGRGLG